MDCITSSFSRLAISLKQGFCFDIEWPLHSFHSEDLTSTLFWVAEFIALQRIVLDS